MKRLLKSLFILIICVTCMVACGSKPETYTITYRLNCDDGVHGNPTTYTTDQEIVLRDATRDGYTFAGWYTDSFFTTRIEKIEKGTTGNLIIYAKWEHIHTSRTLVSISTAQDGEHIQATFRCNECGKNYTDTLTWQDINTPIVNITGDLSGISKDNKLKVAISCDSEDVNFDCYTTIKLQGASSVRHNYPKQNYSIQLFNDAECSNKKKIEFVSGWGEESKYVLKANWVDFSHIRNIVSAKIYGDIVHSRDLQDEIASLYNGGAIDGYPVLLYENGYYKGLYTLNIPKDKWMFGMGDGEYEAILMGDGYSETTKLLAHVSDDFESSKMDLEYCSTEKTDTSWVVTSFNNMIDFLNENDGADFKAGVSNYINLDRTMDSIIYTLVMSGADNYQNNIIYVTYDGVHWQTSVYDMDSTWGSSWDGRFNIEWNDTTLYDPDWHQTTDIMRTNLLFKRIWENYHDEIVARYTELRAGALSNENISNKFITFNSTIPAILRNTDKSMYADIPSVNTNNLNQILTFIQTRLADLDALLQ